MCDFTEMNSFVAAVREIKRMQQDVATNLSSLPTTAEPLPAQIRPPAVAVVGDSLQEKAA